MRELLISIFVALVVSIFIGTTSAYISLRIGALPWPILLSALLCFSFLKILGITKTKWINVAHAGASLGGIIASAIAFTFPALYFNNKEIVFNPIPLMILAATASLLAIELVKKNYKQIISDEKTRLVSGVAAANTIALLTKKQGSKMLNKFLIALLITGIIVFLRDYFNFGMVELMPSLGVAFYFMPMAIGVGYLLGEDTSLKSLFSGTIIGWLGFLFLGLNAQKIGMGILFGATIVFLIKNIRKQGLDLSKNIVILLILSVLMLNLLFNIELWLAIIAVGLSIFVSLAAMRITAQTDIDPYEQFGIYVGLLLLTLVSGIVIPNLIYVVVFTTIVAAVSADSLFDIKAAILLKTRIKNVLLCDRIVAVFSSIVAPLIIYFLLSQFMPILFTPNMPALQASMVHQVLFSNQGNLMFLLGVLIGVLLLIASPKWFSTQAFGIGMFLGFIISIPFAIGGLLALLAKDRKKQYEIIAISAIAGEGIVGFGDTLFNALDIGLENMAIVLFVFAIGLGFLIKKQAFKNKKVVKIKG